MNIAPAARAQPRDECDESIAAMRRFAFPLNVYAELLRLETGAVDYLHYGLFEAGERDVARAQRRACDWLLERLPAPPLRVLDVGVGLGTTAARLAALGHRVTGITPDPAQAGLAAARAPSAHVVVAAFEHFDPAAVYDLLLFQESSQYIDTDLLFETAARLCAPESCVVIFDEFSNCDAPGPQSLERVKAAAAFRGFELREELDRSAQAARTIDYLIEALERRGDEIAGALALEPGALERLRASNLAYRARYAAGECRYRLLRFDRSDGARDSAAR